MLKIIIIQGKGNVARSPILLDGEFIGLVEGLPGKLQVGVARNLNTIKKSGGSVVECDKQVLTLIIGNKKRELRWACASIRLLHWYLKPHIVELEPGKIDGKIVCHECDAEQLMNFRNKCGNPGCTSHEKWKQVDDNYVVPDAFKSAFMGMPKEGAANEWIRKG